MSKLSHAPALVTQSSPAIDRLHYFLEERRTSKAAITDFEQFEKDLHEIVIQVEQEALAHELSKLDLDVPVVEIEGVAYRQVIRCEETYFGSSGPIRVIRSLYSTRADSERALCPMELRAGIVEGRWTPLAAKQAIWVVAHLTPREGEELFEVMGNMKPSKSSLDRLPKQLSSKWEEDRERFEEELRNQEVVPEEAVTVAMSLDGVLVPMIDGERKEKRTQAAKEGKKTSGSAGYSEASCGTVSFYDKDGELLSTIRLGRMPEKKKQTLKSMLTVEVLNALDERPDLQLIKMADGAKDNWTFLSNPKILPLGEEVADFYHASEHLYDAFCAAYGDDNPKAKAQWEKYRHILRHETNGIQKVIRTLSHLKKKHPKSKKIATELNYFRKNRKRMNYASLKERNLPIGTGIVEAACKTLVTARMKRSGMRWRHIGGQAILTFRSLVQSDRFEHAWELLKVGYKKKVVVPENVIALNARRGK
jgi:hypothetical protein